MNAVLNQPEAESITLYFREGGSDKVYQARIEPDGELFRVNFSYGRRGSTMQTGTKTSSPVDYDTAKGIYDKLVREKTAKGYTPGQDGTPYQHSDKADITIAVVPRQKAGLLNVPVNIGLEGGKKLPTLVFNLTNVDDFLPNGQGVLMG